MWDVRLLFASKDSDNFDQPRSFHFHTCSVWQEERNSRIRASRCPLDSLIEECTTCWELFVHVWKLPCLVNSFPLLADAVPLTVLDLAAFS